MESLKMQLESNYLLKKKRNKLKLIKGKFISFEVKGIIAIFDGRCKQ
ncbi:hypothetical protein TSIB_1227 [Thermococcus sibiricus MM 739]|uniref:Uncharacterized protein n=1 Tax=Thermococcus sibiricus (strain DSM 12597 / MM 739) TaxID=604354 RepID=C6A3T6_THESM|nr:hypothetical protein TSIB_1227 [Thermococcus sibiricus MM 739]